MIKTISLDLDEIGLEPRTRGNSLPNPWEFKYGFSFTDFGLASTNDSDSDGLSPSEEYVADTNPSDSNQVFQVERQPEEEEGAFSISWD